MEEELWNLAIELESRFCTDLLSKTTESKKQYDEGKQYLAGGVASGYFSLSPYPIYCNKGERGLIFDVDGNQYVDLSLCLGANMIGHGHPKIQEAITKQISQSVLLGTTSTLNIDLAKRLNELYNQPQWRFMNSGTEATRDAIQIARAIKGVDEIIKVEGGYHGQHESVCVSYHPDLNEDCGTLNAPKSIASHPGIPDEMVKKTIIIPFNCPKNIIENQIDSTPSKKVSCIIVEPIIMNCAIILPRKNFLQDIQEICKERDILFILDEVKTNTTTSIGGASQLYNIIPDMVCLGKSCSGGIPFGALGMSKEIAEYVIRGEPSVNSTFGGNCLAMTCSLTTLNSILTEEEYNRIDSLQTFLKSEIINLLKLYNIPGNVITIGAKGCIVFMENTPQNYREWKVNNSHWIDYALHTFLLTKGIWMSGPGEEWTISIQHTKEDLMYFVNVLNSFFKEWNENLQKK